MALSIFLLLLSLLRKDTLSNGIKFSADSFAEISVLAEKGKIHLESLREKATYPHYGSCWKKAITNLQVGCKFLSENVQRDLALGFTDCFLQMSGHEPLSCNFDRNACLKKFSDREFNAYTEFYTHTQSICYFLQSQVWHEETEKTINKLFSATLEVSTNLEEAGKVQKKLLHQQKESLVLQNDIFSSSKNVASALQLSEDKITAFMNDFKSAAAEQKELLGSVFENLALFKSWAVSELSWFNSTIYFATAALISFLFTSVSRTREARMTLFIVFGMNYVFERSLTSSSVGTFIFGNDVAVLHNSLNTWIWFCRRFCICLAFAILSYTAVTYYDYNLHNYKLLLEIKKQNIKILNLFDSLAKNQNMMTKSTLNDINYGLNQLNSTPRIPNYQKPSCSIQENIPKHLSSKNLYFNNLLADYSNCSSRDSVDAKESKPLNKREIKSLSSTSDTSKVEIIQESKFNYNLRSLRRKTLHLPMTTCTS